MKPAFGVIILNVKETTIEQLSVVRTLYKSRLDSELMEQERKISHLLVEPMPVDPIVGARSEKFS